MSLSKERLGEIALLGLQHKMEKDDVLLKPSEIKRDVSNLAKRFGVPVKEFAEFEKNFISEAYRKVVLEPEKIIAGKVED